MFQAFDDLLFVLDEHGRILDYKVGRNSVLSLPVKGNRKVKLQEMVSLDVRQKYEQALHEIRQGSKVVLFEHRSFMSPPDDSWYESRLVATTNRQTILFVRNITEHKKSTYAGLTQAYDKTIEGWTRALHLRDHETEDHTRRVADMTVQLARRLDIPGSDLIHIHRGAALHDIGKMAIPDQILFKPGPLTEDEWVVMRRHPVIAEEILKPVFYLAPALNIPRCHHERWDGSGYPDGLVGENIPLPARIFTLADVYDALTSDRPYRRAWSHADAIDHIRKYSGTHFDPGITPVFVDMMSR